MNVSIIVPVYNVENYIEKCIRSLFNQTYRNIQFIFVDDYSTDNSMSIVHSIIQEYGLVDVLILSHTSNMGLPAARNTGLEVATGEYILHCDSDDWVDPDMVERLVHTACMSNADIVFCDFYNIYGDKFLVYKQKECGSYEEYVVSFMEGTSQASVCNKLIRKSIYDQNNITFPDGYSMLEDFRTVVQLFYYAKVIVYCPGAMYYYVKTRADSISGIDNDTIQILREDHLENVQGILQFLESKNILISEDQKNLFKLGPKKNLLIKGKTIEAYKKWKIVFPEANSIIWKTDYPLPYKFLAYAADKGWWFIIKIWIVFKYNLLKR